MNFLGKITITLLLTLVAASASGETFTPAQVEMLNGLINDARNQLVNDLKKAGVIDDKFRLSSLVTAMTPGNDSTANKGIEEKAPLSPEAKAAIAYSLVEGAGIKPDAQLFLDRTGIGDILGDVESGRDAFQVDASTDSNKATLKVSRQVSQAYADTNDPSIKSALFSNFTLTASAPIDKRDDGTINTSTLDGLGDAFEVGLKYSWYRGLKLKLDDILDPNNDAKFSPRFEHICRMAGLDPDKGNGCDLTDIRTALEKKGLDALAREFKGMFFDLDSWQWSAGFEGTIGHQEFDYINPTSLTRVDRDKNPWALKAHFGFIPPRWESLFTAAFEFQESYSDAKSGTLCPMGMTADPSQCVTGIIGGPKNSEKQLASLEWRTKFSTIPLFGLGDTVGIRLSIVHDIKNNDTGIDLPIYFVPDANNNLQGGIRFGWTDTDGESIGIFGGSSFQVFD